MIRVVRLDLEPSLSTAERLDAAFARARELDDGVSPHVVGIVEFPLRGDGSVLMRIDRADLFMHDQSTADVSRDELQALRQWMLLNKDDVMRWRGSVRAKPLNPGEIRWSETARDVTMGAGMPVSRASVRWGRTQGTLPPSEPDPSAG